MHCDFPTTAKSARAAIPVPNVPLKKILSRSRALSNHDRLRMVVATGALALAAVAGGTVGPKIYGGIQFWFSGGRWAVAVHSLTIMSPPTVAELRTVTKNATFRVVYPVGLPAGTHLIRIMFAPATHPTSITLNYLNARSGYFGGFTLIDSRIVNATAFPHPGNGQTLYGVASAHLTRLQIGDETVVAFGDKGPPARMHGIEAAMQSTSPAAALSANEAMLWKIRLLSGVWEFGDVADRLAADRSGVLIGRGDLRLIPGLARRNQPLRAARATYLTNIPYSKGLPEYNRASMRWEKDVAVDADGVRAVAAVMSAAGESGRWTDCCEILYTAPENGTYTLWTLPMKKSQPITKYEVDARTYRVRS